ncbi:hypothetical protein D3C73_1565840 [compost metagenome]
MLRFDGVMKSLISIFLVGTLTATPVADCVRSSVPKAALSTTGPYLKAATLGASGSVW